METVVEVQNRVYQVQDISWGHMTDQLEDHVIVLQISPGHVCIIARCASQQLTTRYSIHRSVLRLSVVWSIRHPSDQDANNVENVASIIHRKPNYECIK